MNTNIVNRTAILTLGFVAWLALPQCGHCFYNPSTGRWLSRDPVAEPSLKPGNRPQARRQAATADYTFCANKPTQYFDIRGLYTEEERQQVCDDYEKAHPPTDFDDPEGVAKFSGTVICKGGTPYPCIFNKSWKTGFREDVFACFMKHEESHAEDAKKQKWCDTCLLHRAVPELKKGPNCHKCPPFPPRPRAEEAIKSECKAYKALFDCLNKFTKENPRPVGWGIADNLIEGYLMKYPGKCSKEFPGDRIPWDY